MTRGQMGFACEGMMPETIDESNIADVFAVWAERIADVNATIAGLPLSVPPPSNRTVPTM